MVKKTVPSYLRVHRGDPSTRETLPSSQSASDGFWNAFSNVTGWRVDRVHRDRVRVLPAVGMDLMAGEPDETVPAVVREDAAELARRAAEITREIEDLRAVVRRQEVELASSAAITFSPTESARVAEQVHRTLQQAITATGFDSAAIYLLDEQTEFLHTRAVVGLPESRLTDEPRPLRGSRADLEALVQDAVLMDDLSGHLGETYAAPEQVGAAICTVLMKADLPIGTLWLFASEPKSLDASHSAIARLASTQLTLQLSAAASARKEETAKESKQVIREIAGWQYASLPAGSQLAPGWFADGMIESPSDLATGWHVWDVLPDGSLMLAIGEAMEASAGGAMVAATARAALEAHGGYRHTPRQMMQRISDTLWQSNTADQLFSLLYCRINPETGEGDIAVAGQISGLIAGPRGYRPLIAPNERPLASAIDIECTESTFHLKANEHLLAYGNGVTVDGVGQRLLGCTLKTALLQQDKPLVALRREMAAFPLKHERGLVCLSRSD
ncbi:MAG: SpoIIE family protein phosphatase [Planctomycetota bacterium]